MLNSQPLNSVALSGAAPVVVEEPGGGEWRRIPLPGGLNAGTLNSRPINGTGHRWVWVPGEATILYPPGALRTAYLLEIDGVRIPMASFQATVRSVGQSYLQAVIPSGSAYVDDLITDAPMRVLMGLRDPNGSYQEIEEIAAAPLQTIRHDLGGTGDTLSVSGYGTLPAVGSLLRNLEDVSYRSINQGRRRVRCRVDLLLRPGHLATDSDGATFQVGQIQYFINARNESMEVLQYG